jgi:hypothetical protein
VLEAEDGALLDRDMKTARVSASGIDPSGLTGPGWRIELKNGWTVQPGERTGDFVLKPTEAADR